MVKIACKQMNSVYSTQCIQTAYIEPKVTVHMYINYTCKPMQHIILTINP